MKIPIPIVLILLAASPVAAQWFNLPLAGTPRTRDGKPDLAGPVPKAADGKPDLSGIWQIVRPGDIPPDAASYASLEYWLPAGTAIPMQPGAEAVYKRHLAAFGAGRPSEQCLPHGIPDSMLVSHFKIVQNPVVTMVLFEEFNHYRQIFTDGRPQPNNPNPAWLGYSTAKWEGNNLIVDSRGFNDRTWLDDAGHPHSEALHTTERFHRTDFGHLEIHVTIDDPKSYTKPWTVALNFRLLPDTELIEDMCENEKDSAHLRAK